MDVRCPDTQRFPNDDLIGCGSTNVQMSDDKLYDCLDCGLWFDPSREKEAANEATERA